MYKVEKGIELKGTGLNRYPLEKMDVGDSFLIPEKDLVEGDIIKTRTSVFNAVSSLQRKTLEPFKIRTLNQDGGLRVWRVL